VENNMAVGAMLIQLPNLAILNSIKVEIFIIIDFRKRIIDSSI